MRPARPLLCALLLAAASWPSLLAQGQSMPDPTVRYLEIPEIVRRVREELDQGNAAASVLVWAVDVDTQWKSGMRAELADAIADVFGAMPADARPRMAAAVLVGSNVQVVGKVTRDAAAAAQTLRELDAKDPDSLRDIMGGLRLVASGLPAPAAGGKSHVVVISLENVDGENDVEETARLLRERGILLHVIGRPAYLSDSYWTVRQGRTTLGAKEKLPGGLRMAGPDAPVRELPAGWAYDKVGLDNVPPAGFGTWAWSRLTALTGGQYYAYYPGGPDGPSFCSYHRCPFCDGAHDGCMRPYAEGNLKTIRPELGSREEFRVRAAGSPVWKAITDGWDAAVGAGVTMTLPPGFGTTRPADPRKSDGYNSKYSTAYANGDWKSIARQAAKSAKTLDEGIEKVVKALGRVDAEGLRGNDPRGVAVLETLEAQLKGARFNLNQLALFCEKILAEEAGQDKPGPLEEPLDPDKASCEGNPRKGLYYENVFFCHGTAPIRQVRWLGGEAAKQGLQDLCDTIDRNLKTHRHTPFEIANRRIALAVYEARWFST